MTTSATAPACLQTAVVVGGGGAVGQLFVRHLAGSGAAVTVIDAATAPAPQPERHSGPAPHGTREPRGGTVIRADARHPDGLALAALEAADAVLLTLPEAVCLQALPGLVAALRPGTLLVDTLSVKGPYARALARLPASQLSRVEVLGLNPMFAPALGFAGRAVAAVTTSGGERVTALLELLRQWGARVVPCTEPQHDRLTAVTQALTHATVLAFGAALAELDVDVAELTPLAPPPHALLLGLLARIASGAPEVYWDIQSANPDAGPARDALARGLHRLGDVVGAGDQNGLALLMRDVRGRFGGELARYASEFARTLADVHDPTGPDPRAPARRSSTHSDPLLHTPRTPTLPAPKGDHDDLVRADRPRSAAAGRPGGRP